jgi:hypothetical protein
MRLGGVVTTDHFLLMPRMQGNTTLQAGASSYFAGVVFAILFLGVAVYRRRAGMHPLMRKVGGAGAISLALPI